MKEKIKEFQDLIKSKLDKSELEVIDNKITIEIEDVNFNCFYVRNKIYLNFPFEIEDVDLLSDIIMLEKEAKRKELQNQIESL